MLTLTYTTINLIESMKVVEKSETKFVVYGEEPDLVVMVSQGRLFI